MLNTDSQSSTRSADLLTRLPLAWISIGFLTGIWLASRVMLPWYLWLISAGILLIVVLLVKILLPRLLPNLPVHIFLISLSLFGLSLGGLRYQLGVLQQDPTHISWYNDRSAELLITGVIDAPADVRAESTNLRVQVTAVDAGQGDVPVDGLILARVGNDEEWHYGEIIRLRGRLITPPDYDDFSYRDYLARQGIFSTMSYATATRLPYPASGHPFLRLVYGFREQALDRIYILFPDPEASLLAGILLGEDNGLPGDLAQAFRNTGTSHIIAISGFNITIIAGLLIIIFGRLFGRNRGTIAAIIGILIYTFLVGASASVVRAAIMGTFAILARQLGRRQSGVNMLCLTGALMTVIDQHMLWDVGFQLSFFATLGIILYAQPLQEWAERLSIRFSIPEGVKGLSRLFSELILIPLAAQLAALPIVAWHFGTISLVAFIANPFILPVQPLVMTFCGVALLVSFLYLPLGQILAWIAWLFPAYTVRVVELFDRLPRGTIHLGDFSLLFVLAYYLLIFSFTFTRGALKKAVNAFMKPAVILVSLGTLSFLTWSAALNAPDGNLHIIFFDAGSADSILIQTPNGGDILINGGMDTMVLTDALGRRLSPFVRDLDWLILASTQENQVAALPAMVDKVTPDALLWSGQMEASWAATELDRWLADHPTPVTQAVPGMVLDLGSGAVLRVQNVTSRGAILLVEWEGFRLMLPIGQNFASLAESENGASIGPVTALLLSDSGLAQTNPPEWIDNLQPQVVILSVAAGDESGLPDDSVLESVEGITLLRTDRNGWIKISTDGESMWLEVKNE